MSNSGNNLGGVEYDDLIEGIELHPQQMPDVMVCSYETLLKLTDQFRSQQNVELDGEKLAGYVIGIPVWIDNRFDQPMLISGLDND
jgi:hypothetical protein